MESLTKENATILLNTNSIGGKMIREDYKDYSIVRVLSEDGHLFDEYKFKNIGLEYETKYMNWQNVDCCGGWDYSNLDLLEQVKSDKKLFAQLCYSESMYYKDEIDKLLVECAKIDSIRKKEVPGYGRRGEYAGIILFKDGSVSDYIDVDKVLNDYRRFGIFIPEEAKETIKKMADTSMREYITPDNVFGYNFMDPDNIAEFIFTGMLLGYPLESTVSRINGD